MNLSIFELKDIKKHCDNFSDCISQILKEKYFNSSDTPFNSLSDYEKSVSEKLINPQNYYKVQIYNRMTFVSYRKNTKNYHIVVRGFYSDKLNSYKRFSNSTDSYVIGSDFDKTLDVWYDVVLDCISTLHSQQELIF